MAKVTPLRQPKSKEKENSKQDDTEEVLAVPQKQPNNEKNESQRQGPGE